MRLSRSVVVSNALPAPKFRYSPVVKAGPFVFVSGLIALDRDSGALTPGGAFEQAARILVNLKALLDEQGWSMEQVVMARIFCVDFDATFSDVNRAWEAVFTDAVPPARTSIGVAALPLGAKVEIEVQLVVGDAG